MPWRTPGSSGVHGVDGEQRIGHLLQGADHGQGIPHRGARRDAHEVGRHDAAGAVLVEREMGLDVGGLLGLHAGEDLLGHLLVQVLQHVGGGGGRHLFEDVGGALLVHAFEQVGQALVADLFEGLGGGLLVEGGDDLGALAVGERIDDARQVDRVELGQAVVRDLELHRRGGRQVLDVGPVDDLAADDAAGQGARPEPAQQGAGADVHPDDPVGRPRCG